ncbi:MAG: glyoxylate/hydroxypyruvate reductase A [Neomegalonema sp.]|nr:glyoxylate/hydroxypyruvate reductase A [Neomegalonema sp.]
MATTALFAGATAQREIWIPALERAIAAASVDIKLVREPEQIAPDDVDYLIYAPNGPLRDLSAYRNLKAILSLWAGVETIVGQANLPNAPLVRMVEPGLTEGMRDYVVGHVMRHHLHIPAQQAAQVESRWSPELAPPLARDRRVGILGMGELGRAAALALSDLGFQVAGWSRRPKNIPEIEGYAGAAELLPFLGRSEILVCLLPLTTETKGLLGAAELASMPKGGCLINAGRGPIIDDAALLAALRDHLSGATLDVFAAEPLPQDHPFWSQPNLLITPHIASVTRPETASQRIVFHIESRESGANLSDVVDQGAGY